MSIFSSSILCVAILLSAVTHAAPNKIKDASNPQQNQSQNNKQPLNQATQPVPSTTQSSAAQPSAPKPSGLFGTDISPRTYIGDSFLGLVKATDQWIGRDHIQESNRSFLKAEYQSTVFEQRTNESDLRLRAKVHLPGTRKRLKLFVDSDLDQDQALDQRGLDVARGRDINQDDTSAGLEVGTNKKALKRAVQVGIKTGSSLRPFIRLRLEKKWILFQHWELQARQDFWHFDEIGFGETTLLTLLRPINQRLGLNITTEIEYRDNVNPLQYLHEWVLGHDLSDKTDLQYKAGAIGFVRNDEYLQERFAAVTYRRQLNKTWAFVNLTPQVIFSKENNWQAEGAFTIKLEIYFTD